MAGQVESAGWAAIALNSEILVSADLHPIKRSFEAFQCSQLVLAIGTTEREEVIAVVQGWLLLVY